MNGHRRFHPQKDRALMQSDVWDKTPARSVAKAV
ncbi:unnamed protein product [Mycetohabitans rhizoxinica HKI 454]|uniref:Uncharacterized protein n=1 Tax=Mycetohabitans rhizoxinica (strain DSM 19002 / CIP 109453 / HKI 454) TaxID=882378 RepID=E5AMC9_MYCRK|nr:unnamed protein product [Mycetohabitans rhizoxinica HKI 454]